MKLGFLLSGSGSTYDNMMEKLQDLGTPAKMAVVISSRPDVYGVVRAKKSGVPVHIVEYKKYNNDIEEYSRAITKILEEYQVELVIMGGFMSFYQIPEKYIHRVMNVHPALIPAFCGKGMYGHKVHEAVYQSGVKVTGCTVHFVDNEYDHGPIIDQAPVEIIAGDTPDTIAEKVVDMERKIYPRAVDAIVRGRYEFKNGRVFINHTK